MMNMLHAQTDPHLLEIMSQSSTLFSRSPCSKTGVPEEHALTVLAVSLAFYYHLGRIQDALNSISSELIGCRIWMSTRCAARWNVELGHARLWNTWLPHALLWSSCFGRSSLRNSCVLFSDMTLGVAMICSSAVSHGPYKFHQGKV